MSRWRNALGESYLTELGGTIAELDPNSSIYQGGNEGADMYDRQAEAVAARVLRDLLSSIHITPKVKQSVEYFAWKRGINLEPQP